MSSFTKIKLVFFIIALIFSEYKICAEQRRSSSQKVAGENSAAFVSDVPRDVIYVLDGLIDMCSIEGNDNVEYATSLADTAAFSLLPLDFLIGACENTGFYEAGEWHSDDVGTLPRFADCFPEELYSCCRPVKGKITSSVGYRRNRRRMHYGVDFSAEVGDTVAASFDGIVSRVGYDRGGYGLFLFIKNSSGVEGRYAHLSRILVQQGDTVFTGRPVALTGNTGLSTGPHLHFELRYKGEIVDASLFFH